MAEPKVRFKQDDGSNYPAWKMQSVGDMTVELTDYEQLSCGLPLLTSARTGLMFQDEYRSKSSTENDNTLFSVVPRGAVTYRHMSDDNIFHFNINDLVDAGLVSKEYPVFTTVNENSIKLLVEYVNSSTRFLEFCKAQKKGGTRTRLYFNVLKDFELLFPCPAEQRKIADFLSSVDEVIATSEQEVANLETQKKAVMKKIFSQEVRFKRKDGTDFPEWEEDYVGNRCKIQTGKSNTQDAVENGEYPFYVRSPIIYRSNRYLFDTEAVITVGDGVGTGKVYHYVKGKFDLHQRAYAITDFNGMTGRYFYCYFSAFFYDRVRAMTAKTSVDSVRYEMIDKMTIRIPCFEEQHLIADFLSNFDEAIAAAKKEMELWKELKKGLLQQMFV